jgi:cullin-associated NEDD8-dissociated protein 1
MSWKIRKAAAKLLNSLFATRKDSLELFYSKASPVLVTRLKERVESVQTEVINALIVLVKETGVSSGSVSKTYSSTRGPDNKKRRGESGPIVDMQPIDDAYDMLVQITPSILKKVQKHFSPKIASAPTAIADYALLKEIAQVAPKALQSDLDKLSALFDVTFASGKGSNTNLRFGLLEFMNLFFPQCSSDVLLPYVKTILKPVLSSINEKYSKIAKGKFLWSIIFVIK